MFLSTFYHTYSAINDDITKKCLRADLFGIGIQIFILMTCYIHCGFYSAPEVRYNIIKGLSYLLLILMIIQMNPDFAKIEYQWMRNLLFGSILLLTFYLALIWYNNYSTEEEVEKFAYTIFKSIMYLVLGMFFFISKYPEKIFLENRFVQLTF